MITRVLKTVCAVCTAACLITALGSCSDTSSSGESDKENTASSDTSVQITAEDYIKKALEQQPDPLLDTTTAKGDTSEYGFDNYCKKLYGGLEPDELEDGAISYASSGGNADEISLLKAKDSSKQQELTQLLKNRIDVRHHDFEGYKPEELEKIDKSRVFEANGYSILVISEDAEKIEEAFKKVR